MAGKARDMHVEELREVKAAAARVSRASKSRKTEKARERRLADKARDMRIAELRDRKSDSRTQALEGQAEAKTTRQRTRAPGQIPRGPRRAGRARGQRQGPSAAD